MSIHGLSRHASGRALVLMLLALALLAPARPAAAQGTSGLLPDPIGTGELLRYARRLSLSPEQQQALESFHDQYKVQFRVLRDSEIDAFMASMRRMQMAGTFPKRADVEAFFQDMNRLFGKIRAVDERFFDQLQPILGESQLAMLSRVREARERNRYASARMLSFITGGMPADLSDMLLDVELSGEERSAVDSALAQYEGRLTSQMRKLNEQNSSLFLNMVKAMEERGITDEMLTDPEKMAEVEKTMQQIMMDLARSGLELSQEIHEGNRRSLTRLSAFLSPAHARELRRQFLARGYGEIAPSLAWNFRPFERALEHDDVSAAQREEIRAVMAQVEQQLGAMASEGMNLIDEQRGAMLMAQENPGIWQERAEKVAEFTKRATEAQAGAGQALAAIVGEALAARFNVETEEKKPAGALAAGGAAAAAAAQVAEAAFDAAGGEDGLGEGEAHQWGADQFLPPRISEAHLRRYAELLDLDEGRRAVLSALREEYEARYQAIMENEIAALQQAQATLWQQDPAGGVQGSPEKIDETYRLRRKALDAVRAADGAFFDQIEEAIFLGEKTAGMERVRLARERETWQRGQFGSFGWMGGGQNEPYVDVALVVRRLRFDEATMDKLDEVMHEYVVKTTPVLRDRYAGALEMQAANEKWSLEIQRLQSEGSPRPEEYQQIYARLVGGAANRVKTLNAEIAKANRAAVESLASRLDADGAWRLQQDYRTRAFPGIYNDQTAVERHLRGAAELTDLSPEQRRRLEELSVEYLPAYATMSEKMIGDSADETPWMSDDPQAWIKFQQRQEAIARIRFDREELNSRAVSRLRTILSGEQIARLGGLPEVTMAEAKEWWQP